MTAEGGRDVGDVPPFAGFQEGLWEFYTKK